MMNYRTIKTSLVENILGPAEAGRFRTIGFQGQGRQAKEVLNSSRTVDVFYSSGEFSRRGSRQGGASQHDITFRIELTVSKAAQGDLSVINNPVSTPQQISTALSNFQEAAFLADNSFDELVDIIYQIVMDGRNLDMGLSKGNVANRFIPRIQKNSPVPRGEYVVLTGSMDLTLRTSEAIVGDTLGGVATEFGVVVDIDGDDNEKTGVEGTLGG